MALLAPQKVPLVLYVFDIHSWTRTARLKHGHRIFRLGEDLEMLCLTPDFKTLRLTGIWWASGWHLSGA